MKGSVLAIDDAKGTGVISGDDGNRYYFSTKDVKGNTAISIESKVDFDIDNDTAKEIYGVVGTMDAQFVKTKSLEVGKEALSIGKGAASKAGAFLGQGILRRFVAGGFNIMSQIFAVMMPVVGFYAGGMPLMHLYSFGNLMNFHGFNAVQAVIGLVAGVFVMFVGFGMVFAILDIRDNTRKTAELLAGKSK